MDKYYVYIPNHVTKVTKKFPRDWKLRIDEKVRELETNPFLGIPMQGKYSDRRKIVIWPYRVVYVVDKIKKVIEIKEIESRGNMSYD